MRYRLRQSVRQEPNGQGLVDSARRSAVNAKDAQAMSEQKSPWADPPAESDGSFTAICTFHIKRGDGDKVNIRHVLNWTGRQRVDGDKTRLEGWQHAGLVYALRHA